MANYIALFIPLLMLLIGIEWWYSVRRNDRKYNGPNTAMNMAVGAIDQIGALFYMFLLFVAMDFSKKHFQLIELSVDWRQCLLAFIAIDFVSYWYHRFSHRNNFLWAGHVTHHSSSYFNLSNGFRTSPFQGLFRIPFWMLMPIIGFDPLLLVVMFKVLGLFDFFVHTPYVSKLGWLEKVIVTPSHHRVHHGKNEIYIDKNYGSVLILWDKFFGTFQEETETVEYGIKSNYVDESPINAITYHFQTIRKQWLSSVGLKRKVGIFLLPPEACVLEGQHGDLSTSFKSSRFGQNRDSIQSSRHKAYATWLLIWGSLGFVYTLFIYLLFSVIIIGYAFLVSSTSIVQGALILNRKGYDWRVFEMFRLIGMIIIGYFLLDEYVVIVTVFLISTSLIMLVFVKK